MLALNLLPAVIARYHRALTPRRAANAARVAASYLMSRLAGRDVRWGRPFVLMAEPTNICNLMCPLCPSGNGDMTRPRGKMGVDAFRRVFEQLSSDLLLLMLWNQGEPFINPHLNEMVRMAKAHNVPTITSTNAHYIRTQQDAEEIVASGLDEIIVSLDGASAETYAKYRKGGSFHRVLEGIRHLTAAKRRLGADNPVVHVQFIIMKHNESEIEDIRRLAEGLGANRLALKTAQVYTRQEAREYLPSSETQSRYRYDTEELTTKSKIANTCRHLWYSTVVTWDGTVSPCCFDKDLRYGLGNALGARTFDDIWSGEAYTSFRNAILKDRASVPMCRNCSEGLKGQFYDIETVR